MIRLKCITAGIRKFILWILQSHTIYMALGYVHGYGQNPIYISPIHISKLEHSI